MDSSTPDNTSHHIPVPKELYASDTGKPMEHCLMCNLYLLHDDVAYVIEKAMKQHPELNVTETIFEYALCMPCAMKMNESMSTESRERIMHYFTTNVDLERRRLEFLYDETFHLDAWIDQCVIKNTPIRKSAEYQIVAQCQGKNLLFTHLPMALSFEAMDEMSQLLSAKSLGEIDDFIGKYFSGPPEVAALLKKKFVLI